jgi:F0F1-type ATP synthase membrane subunit b/b'
MELLKFLNLEMSEAIMIPINCFIFYLFYKLFSKKVILPVQEFVEEREASTSGAERVAREIHEEAEALNCVVLEELEQQRKESLKLKATILNEAKIKSAKLLEDAQNEAVQYLAEERKKIDQNRKNLKAELQGNLEVISSQVFNSITLG